MNKTDLDVTLSNQGSISVTRDLFARRQPSSQNNHRKEEPAILAMFS